MSALARPAWASVGTGHSDVGRHRPNNEDSWLMEDPLGLYAVADGIGGGSCGELASRTAVESVLESARRMRGALPTAGFGILTDRGLAHIGRALVQAAADRVYDCNSRWPALGASGTTLTVALFAQDRAVMAHVGDSRLYRCRDGELTQLSADHTVAAESARMGLERTFGEHWDHVLTRSLGSQSVDPEVAVLDVAAGDVYLLCSDGLTRELSDEELCAELACCDDKLAWRLVSQANARGGHDNITAVVVRIDDTRTRHSRLLDQGQVR